MLNMIELLSNFWLFSMRLAADLEYENIYVE